MITACQSESPPESAHVTATVRRPVRSSTPGGEGQLDPTEYQNRTTQAMQAKTLGELASLVADLQIPAHLVEAARESTPTPRTPIEGRAVAAVVVAVLAIGATALYTTGAATPRRRPWLRPERRLSRPANRSRSWWRRTTRYPPRASVTS